MNHRGSDHLTFHRKILSILPRLHIHTSCLYCGRYQKHIYRSRQSHLLLHNLVRETNQCCSNYYHPSGKLRLIHSRHQRCIHTCCLNCGKFQKYSDHQRHLHCLLYNLVRKINQSCSTCYHLSGILHLISSDRRWHIRTCCRHCGISQKHSENSCREGSKGQSRME